MKGYLVLGDRLIQVWLNKVTISSSILVIKIAIFCFLISRFLKVSENFILSRCEEIDKALNSVGDELPQYLSTVGNYMVKKSMVESIDLSLNVVSLLVTASEELLSFFIELYLGTYACLVVSTIDGTVDVAVNTTEHIIGFVNETVSDMANTLDDGLNGLSKVINKVLSTANKIENAFKGNSQNSVDDNIHKVNLTSSKLRHFSIPPTINSKLQRLSQEVPSFDQLKNETRILIDIPFKQVKQKLDKLNPQDLLPADQNILYIPDPNIKNGQITGGICSASIPDIKKVFDAINSVMRTVVIVILVVGIIVVISTTIPPIYAEYKLWRRLNKMQDELDSYIEAKSFLFTDEDSSISSNHLNGVNDHFSIIESYYNAFERLPTKASTLVTKNPTNRTRFFMHFVLSNRASGVLLIAVLGIIVCGIQFGILHAIDRQVARKSLDTDNSVFPAMSKAAESYAMKWSSGVNTYINETEANINRELFGWVQNTTSTINSTVVWTKDKIDTTLADIFNGTLLYGPMKTVANCAIERKLVAVEQAMTWVNKHAHATIPRINTTEVSALVTTAPQHLKYTGLDTQIDFRKYIKNITAVARRSTLFELYVSLALLAIWLLQIPTALILLYFK